jgi:hypothetical protein
MIKQIIMTMTKFIKVNRVTFNVDKTIDTNPEVINIATIKSLSFFDVKTSKLTFIDGDYMYIIGNFYNLSNYFISF